MKNTGYLINLLESRLIELVVKNSKMSSSEVVTGKVKAQVDLIQEEITKVRELLEYFLKEKKSDCNGNCSECGCNP